MKPIAEDERRDDVAWVADRCAAFKEAIFIYRIVMRSNPVHGQDVKRGKVFAWIAEIDVPKTETSSPSETDFARQYLDDFGGVMVPTLVPNKPLYQSDKATCIAEFGS